MSRVMIVDDEVDILKSLKRLLRVAPCTYGGQTFTLEVEAFSVPSEALERARHEEFDLFISDFRMPKMDGIEFLKGTKELQPDAARLILSGYADLNGLIGAINEAGITRFISKPWNDYELIATLGQVLTLRELTLENQRLADQVRLEAGALSAEEIERKRLEAIEPGITRVIWGPDGSVLLDESLLDDAAH